MMSRVSCLDLSVCWVLFWNPFSWMSAISGLQRFVGINAVLEKRRLLRGDPFRFVCARFFGHHFIESSGPRRPACSFLESIISVCIKGVLASMQVHHTICWLRAISNAWITAARFPASGALNCSVALRATL